MATAQKLRYRYIHFLLEACILIPVLAMGDIIEIKPEKRELQKKLEFFNLYCDAINIGDY